MISSVKDCTAVALGSCSLKADTPSTRRRTASPRRRATPSVPQATRHAVRLDALRTKEHRRGDREGILEDRGEHDRRNERHGGAAEHAAERDAHEIPGQVRRVRPAFGETCVTQHRQHRERRKMRQA